VFALPGSSKAVGLGVQIIAPILEHACDLAMARRTTHG
jgi:molybdopterin biosynthesis enzyme MoaB